MIKQFAHSMIGQLFVALSSQPRHHFAPRGGPFCRHEHLLIPTQVTLKGTESVNVLHALNELLVGFHGGFNAPCFFNTPPGREDTF